MQNLEPAHQSPPLNPERGSLGDPETIEYFENRFDPGKLNTAFERMGRKYTNTNNSITTLPMTYAAKLEEAKIKAGLKARGIENPIDYTEARRELYFALIDRLDGRELEVTDQQTKDLFAATARYISGEGGYAGSLLQDPKKGILLIGSVGVGKTLLMRAIQRAFVRFDTKRRFDFHAAQDVFEAVANDKKERGAEIEIERYYKGHRCFDDVGSETKDVVSFGNRIEVMANILSARHRAFERDGTITHMTTNLTMEQLKTHFGVRIEDRLYQMFNIVEVGGESKRK